MKEMWKNWTMKRGCNCSHFKQELWISLPVQFAVDPASSSLLLSRQEKALQMLMTRIKDHHITQLIKPMDSVVVDCSSICLSRSLSHILDFE